MIIVWYSAWIKFDLLHCIHVSCVLCVTCRSDDVLTECFCVELISLLPVQLRTSHPGSETVVSDNNTRLIWITELIWDVGCESAVWNKKIANPPQKKNLSLDSETVKKYPFGKSLKEGETVISDPGFNSSNYPAGLHPEPNTSSSLCCLSTAVLRNNTCIIQSSLLMISSTAASTTSAEGCTWSSVPNSPVPPTVRAVRSPTSPSSSHRRRPLRSAARRPPSPCWCCRSVRPRGLRSSDSETSRSAAADRAASATQWR